MSSALRGSRAVDSIFQEALSAAAREGTLREGLHPEVLKAIFWAAVGWGSSKIRR